MNISQILEDRISHALHLAGAPKNTPAILKPSGRPEFGDYQANGVMGIAKTLKTNPRALAAKVVEHLQLDDIATKVETEQDARAIIIAGGGDKTDPLWIATNSTANFAYRTLLYKGLSKINIRYYNIDTAQDVDKDGSNNDIVPLKGEVRAHKRVSFDDLKEHLLFDGQLAETVEKISELFPKAFKKMSINTNNSNTSFY